MKTLVSAAVFAASISMSAHSLEIDDITTIYITGNRSPEYSVDTAASIRVISKEDIIESGASSVTDVLRGQHGIHIYDLYGDSTRATIDMRGFSSTAVSNVVVMIDGRKLNSSTDGPNLSLNDIPIENIERIEVVHGSSGVLFGNQSVGGVINIITHSAKNNLSSKISTKTGSFGQLTTSAQLSTALNEKTTISINAKKSVSDGYRDHNSSEAKSFKISSLYKDGDTSLFITHNQFDEYVENPGTLELSEVNANRRQAYTDYLNDFTETKSATTSLNANKILSNKWELQIDSSFKNDDVKFKLSSRGTPRLPTDTQDRENLTFNPRLQGRFSTSTGEIKTTIGADISHTDYSINALKAQTSEQFINAFYGQVTYPLSHKLNLSIGARYAEVDNHIVHAATTAADHTILDLDDNVTVGSLGLTFRPSDKMRFFARADQNYRFALIEEHTGDYYANNISPYIPQGVKNQEGLSLETGFEFSQDTSSIFIQAYLLELDNEISFSSAQYANVNIDKTKRKGINLSVTESFSETLRLKADLDLIDGEITGGDHKGKTIPMVPKTQLKLSANWNVDLSSNLGIEVLYVSEQVLDSDFDNSASKLSSYSVTNISGLHKKANWTFNARLNNIFNRLYSEFGTYSSWTGSTFNPSPERNLWVGATYTFE